MVVDKTIAYTYENILLYFFYFIRYPYIYAEYLKWLFMLIIL